MFPCLSGKSFTRVNFEIYEKTLARTLSIFGANGFFEGSCGIFTLNGIVKGQGPEQWVTIGPSPVQIGCNEKAPIRWGTIGLSPVQIRCNEKAPTKYHTTYVFPVP